MAAGSFGHMRAGVDRTDVHVDTASGAKASRPELDVVLKMLRKGDTLKVTRLDRLSRSVLHLVTLGADLRGRGVGLHVIEQGIDTDTMEGRAMFGMLSVLAELQRGDRRQHQRRPGRRPCPRRWAPAAAQLRAGRAGSGASHIALGHAEHENGVAVQAACCPVWHPVRRAKDELRYFRSGGFLREVNVRLHFQEVSLDAIIRLGDGVHECSPLTLTDRKPREIGFSHALALLATRTLPGECVSSRPDQAI